MLDNTAFSHNNNQPESSGMLFVLLRNILHLTSIEAVLEQLSDFPLNVGCCMIALRRCTTAPEGVPRLEPEAFWLRPSPPVEPWPKAIQVDDDSLAKLWIMGGGPPIFIEKIAEFALFTDASRDFHQQQGVISVYHILLRWQEEPLAVLSVYWDQAQPFSSDYRAMTEFMGWVLAPIAARIYLQRDRDQLALTIAALEHRLGDAELALHSLAHDLKQPLTSIISSTAMLNTYLDRFSREQIIEKLHRISRGGLQMNDWINSILILAQVRGTEMPALESVDMRQVLDSVVNTMQPMLDSRSAQMAFGQGLGELPPVQGNPVWIEHIWANLISNAYKYGGTPPQIAIDAESVDDSVRFSIRDNGPGIPTDKINLIFEPFTRLNLSGNKQSGTGIGLTTVRLLLQKLGGMVGVESGPHGSTFWFTLPRFRT